MTAQDIDQLRAPIASKYCREDGAEIVIPVASCSDDPCVKRTVVRPINRLLSDECGASSFTLLGEVPSASLENLGHRLKVTATLFDFLSDQSSVDHPLCQLCADAVMLEEEKRIKQTEDSLASVRKYAAHLESRSVGNAETEKAELAALEAEEAALSAELDTTSATLEKLEEDIEAEESRQATLGLEEKKAQFELNQIVQKLYQLAEDKESIENRLAASSVQLERLNKHGIFEMAFHIANIGRLAAINGYRMGKLSSVPVEWSEINAGWGQCALLLDALVRYAGLSLQKHKIVPFGSHSYILMDKKELPLYGGRGIKSFWDHTFDAGMVAFLDCISQLVSHCSFALPCPIVDSKLTDGKGNSYSIKTQMTQEDQWSKALGMMLLDLKWLMTAITHRPPRQVTGR